MPDGERPDPRNEDIMAGDRRISRPDASLPDWEVPDSSYRPVPIVWFTGALIFQMIGIYGAFLLLIGLHGMVTIGVAALISGAIAAWTWQRGMNYASNIWKISTIAMLVIQLIFVSMAVSGRL